MVKQCLFGVVKIPFGLTVKPDGMPELNFFEILREYFTNF
jgi:hypothetical protein